MTRYEQGFLTKCAEHGLSCRDAYLALFKHASFSENDKARLFSFLKSRGYLSKEEVDKYESKYGKKRNRAVNGIADRVSRDTIKSAKARLVKKSDTIEPVSSATQYDPYLVNGAIDKPSTGYTAEEADELRKYWSNYALSQALSGRPPAALPWPRESDSNPEFATTGQYLGQIIGDNGEAYVNDFWGRPRRNTAGTLAADLLDAPLGREVETKYPFSGATSNVVNRAIFDNLLVPATPAQTNNVYKAIRAGLGK